MSTTPVRDAPAHVLKLPEHVRAELEDGARLAHPREACGLLIGRRVGRVTEVWHARGARNLASARDRFELDPLDHLAAEDWARSVGLEVVGVWHSHPDRPASPSDLDRADAWSGWSYAIVSVDADGVLDVRAWRLEDGRFVEEEVRA